MVEKSELKCGTDTLVYAVQEQALRTNSVKAMINKTQASSFCRTYQEKTESVTHIVNACANLAKSKYRKRHDKVAKKNNSFLYKKYSFECNAAGTTIYQKLH